MIKTDREIELLRRAVRIGDIGHQALADMPPGPKDINAIKEIMADFGIQLRLPTEPS